MPHHGGGTARAVVLVIDVANVVGSRPDGWWRDRAGAASRLLAAAVALRGETVPGPDAAPLRPDEIVAVVEGAARGATAPDHIDVVPAPRDGDTEIVEQARRIIAAGAVPLVVTADRGLRARLPDGAVVAGPQWLNQLLGR